MKKLNVLLVCGSGASSGFMAANMRKAAVKKRVEMSIIARSESEIENYIDEIDVLMIGPHLAYIMDEVEEYIHGENVKVILMKAEYYSTLDGDKAINHLLENIDIKTIREEK
ncbi:MAG: PTS sugar transporter subunit IIB [Breznakia sp.]